MDPLLGNFFLAEAARTGTVVAPIGIAHFVIRFDDVGAEGPVAIIDIAEMAGSVGADGDPPGWLLFDSVEQRAKYLAWLAESRSGSRRPDAGAPTISFRCFGACAWRRSPRRQCGAAEVFRRGPEFSALFGAPNQLGPNELAADAVGCVPHVVEPSAERRDLGALRTLDLLERFAGGGAGGHRCTRSGENARYINYFARPSGGEGQLSPLILKLFLIPARVNLRSKQPANGPFNGSSSKR
jgi:hypothetical protein